MPESRDNLPDPERGPLLGFFDWWNRPGEIMRSLAAGKTASAGRHLVDFLEDIPDAIIPGTAMANRARPSDYTSTADVIGDMEDGPAKRVVNLLGSEAFNPLTYIPGAASMKAATGLRRGLGAAATAGVDALDAVSGSLKAGTKLGEVARTGKYALGWYDLTPEQQAVLRQGRGAGYQSARVGTERVKQILGSLSKSEDQAVSDVLENLHIDPASGEAAKLLAGTDDLGARLAEWQRRNPVAPIDSQKTMQAIKDLNDFSHLQFEEGVRAGVFEPHAAKPNYVQRQFGFADPSSVFGRTLNSEDDLVRAINDNRGRKDFNYERSALKRSMDRAAQQGGLIERAEVGKTIAASAHDRANAGAVAPAFDPKTFRLKDRRVEIEKEIERLQRDPATRDWGYRAQQVFKGVGKLPPLVDLIDKGPNALFKGAAVYGVGMLRVGSLVRNALGGVWQAATTGNPTGPAAKALAQVLYNAADDAFLKVFGARKLPPGFMTEKLDAVENAFREAKGDTRKLGEILKGDPELKAALDQGVLEGFVQSEDIIGELRRTKLKGNLKNLMDWPAATFQGLEQRMRLGTFMELRARGLPAPDAAKKTIEAFLDYGVSGRANKLARTALPFAQFTAQTIPQQAKFLAGNPWATSAAASLFGGQDEGLVYPWMQQQARVNVGSDEKGNPQYLTSLGLPLEALDQIPGATPRQIWKSLAGNAAPIIKSAVGAGSGEDPYFGTPYGSYDKSPFGNERSESWRAYNKAAGTGLLQPIDSLVKLGANLTSDKKSTGEKALQFLTGARFESVDQDAAEQQIIQQYLKNNPQVGQAQTYFSKGNEDVDALIKALRESKKRAKAARESAEQLPVG